jgi:hypothetical protein
MLKFITITLILFILNFCKSHDHQNTSHHTIELVSYIPEEEVSCCKPLVKNTNPSFKANYFSSKFCHEVISMKNLLLWCWRCRALPNMVKNKRQCWVHMSLPRKEIVKKKSMKTKDNVGSTRLSSSIPIYLLPPRLIYLLLFFLIVFMSGYNHKQNYIF